MPLHTGGDVLVVEFKRASQLVVDAQAGGQFAPVKLQLVLVVVAATFDFQH